MQRRGTLILVNIFMQILLQNQDTTLALEYRTGGNTGVPIHDKQKDGEPKLSPAVEAEVKITISLSYLLSKYSSTFFNVLDQFLVRILCYMWFP